MSVRVSVRMYVCLTVRFRGSMIFSASNVLSSDANLKILISVRVSVGMSVNAFIFMLTQLK